jgi:hypothetical protein
MATDRYAASAPEIDMFEKKNFRDDEKLKIQFRLFIGECLKLEEYHKGMMNEIIKRRTAAQNRIIRIEMKRTKQRMLENLERVTIKNE